MVRRADRHRPRRRSSTSPAASVCPVADLLGRTSRRTRPTRISSAGTTTPSHRRPPTSAPVQQISTSRRTPAGYPTTYNSSTPHGVGLDNMSVYDWIASRVPGGHHSPMGQLLDVAYGEEYGADTSVQSALNLVYLLGFQPADGQFAIFGASDERYHIDRRQRAAPGCDRRSSLPHGSVQTGWQLAPSPRTATAPRRSPSGSGALRADGHCRPGDPVPAVLGASDTSTTPGRTSTR